MRDGRQPPGPAGGAALMGKGKGKGKGKGEAKPPAAEGGVADKRWRRTRERVDDLDADDTRTFTRPGS